MLISIPFINLVNLSILENYSITQFFAHENLPSILLIFTPIIVGIGILKVEKWGWWAFLLYSICLICYNIYAIHSNPVVYNYFALIETVFGVTSIIFFVQKDISAPYFKMYPRGWRGQSRKPISVNVAIVGSGNKSTTDLSVTGFYANWPLCDKNLNEEVDLAIEFEKEVLCLKGGIVRIDNKGFGIAFRYLPMTTKKKLQKFVSKFE